MPICRAPRVRIERCRLYRSTDTTIFPQRPGNCRSPSSSHRYHGRGARLERYEKRDGIRPGYLLLEEYGPARGRLLFGRVAWHRLISREPTSSGVRSGRTRVPRPFWVSSQMRLHCTLELNSHRMKSLRSDPNSSRWTLYAWSSRACDWS